MSRRYLFGPVDATYSEDHLGPLRAAGECRTFGPDPRCDVRLTGDRDFAELCRKLSDGWRPDFVALNLAYRTTPPYLWDAPIPVVALAGDWNLLWHPYLLLLRRADLFLTDGAGVAAFAREGLAHGLAANLYGGRPTFLAGAPPAAVERDIDVLFVGHLHPDIQRERLPWLARLARLGDRYRVVIRRGVGDEEYRRLLARARIVFNRSARGECNQRVWEAAAAGALLLQEEGNREVEQYLCEGREYIAYRDANLEERVDFYLAHDAERQRIAAAGQAKAGRHCFHDLWQQALAGVDERWDDLAARAAERDRAGPSPMLVARVWQHMGVNDGGDATLAPTIAAALRDRPGAELCNALGVALAARPVGGRAVPPALLEKALQCFRQALDDDPNHLVARFNLAAGLAQAGARGAAAGQAGRLLEALGGPASDDPALWQAPHFAARFDAFRVAWEQAAWGHAGDAAAQVTAKKALLAWWAHRLLAERSGDLRHHEAAAQLRPDLPAGLVGLGTALHRAGRPAESLGPLRRALGLNPFDAAAARALDEVLGQSGHNDEQERLRQERRLLAQAAPQLAPDEPWFAGPATPEIRTLSKDDFRGAFGEVDTGRAVCGFTPPADTGVVLTLLAHSGARRILEIGTAGGHMTANLTEWSPEGAVVYSLGVVNDLGVATNPAQARDDPPRAAFGKAANHFGKAHKVFFVTADSLTYDFARLGALDFVFVDGGHDAAHVTADSLNAYRALRPGGLLVWHDFGSATPWVEVRQAVERLPLAEPVWHVAGTEVAFLRKGEAPEQHLIASGVPASSSEAALPPDTPLAINWEGDQGRLHSLALVNRAFCAGLAARGHAVRRLAEPGPEADAPLPRPADVHVRHQWPPDFRPPAEGHWVLIQPWEFGSLPRDWVGPIVEQVDEVWAHTRYVRDVFVNSGVPAERVHLVPLGVDTARFHPGAPPYPLRTHKRWRFLFVGGTIFRKGADVLLDAYARAFRRADDVCLVVKDMGAGSFYQGQTAGDRIRQLQADPEAPEVEYLTDDLSEAELAGLYAACQCLAHPYRGEGFGLPIAEAMACGLPVIVTGLGAALDFCSEDRAYLIPAQRVDFARKRVGDLETVDTPWLAQPDAAALASLLRHVVAHPEEAAGKGRCAAAYVREHLTWDRAVAAAERRLLALRPKPVRRHTRIAGNARPARRRQRVSLCMIVKDEEKNLAACLASVADLVDEIVIVDTGSTDRTREIASQYGARVIDFAWVDSFAAARNESLRHATGDWIVWLDGDEFLDGTNRDRFRRLLDDLPDRNVAYYLRQFSPLADAPYAAVQVDQVRLFRNLPGLKWHYRVHEQILPSLRDLGAVTAVSDVVVGHSGYVRPDEQGPKMERNRRLLELELREHPRDNFVLFNLASTALKLRQFDEALDFVHRSLENSAPGDTVVPRLHCLLVRIHQDRGDAAAAWQACGRGLERFPQEPELLFRRAGLQHERGDLEGCARSLEAILALPHTVARMGADSGLLGHRTRNFLAEVYEQQGQPVKAQEQWELAVRECPQFTPAWRQLARRWADQGRWADVERALVHLERDTALADEVRELRRRAAEAPRTDPAGASVARPASATEASRLPATTPLAARRRWTRSLVMMVKDEEKNLAACLDSARGLFDEIVIIDTGSTDRTREIAQQYGAKVFDFPWVDSFAAARNEGLRHATGDYVFWLDADDRLGEPDRQKLLALFETLDGSPAGFVMKCLCLPDPVTGSTTAVDHVRLFRNLPGLQWEFRVHEQILPALKRAGAALHWTGVCVRHTGYQDPALRARKLRRDLRLLRLELADRPEHPFALFNLGSIYLELGWIAEAEPLFRRSLGRSAPSDSITHKLYVLVATCQGQQGRWDQARQTLAAGRQLFPDDAEVLFHQGATHRALGELPAAIDCWQAVLRCGPGRSLGSANAGLRGYLTHHSLAEAYRALGQSADAARHWQVALADRSDYEPALLGLADLAIQDGKWAEALSLAGRLRAARAPLAALVTRARVHLGQKEFKACLELLDRGIADYPAAIWPRVIRSHALLQMGQLDAAERALRDVLALDPAHEESRQNLRALLAQRGKPVEGEPLLDEGMLARLFRSACATPANGRFRLPALYALASGCGHATAVGDSAAAAAALLFARPGRLVCHVNGGAAQVESLQALANGTQFLCQPARDLPPDIEATDLLLLTASAERPGLEGTLGRYAARVRKYLVLAGGAALAAGHGPEGASPEQSPQQLLPPGQFRPAAGYPQRDDWCVLERQAPPEPAAGAAEAVG